jgi:predicted transcriptional regulator
VLEYVVDRPAAKDTIEGIRLFWLGEEADVLYATLSDALAALVAKNWLVVRSMTRDGGEPLNVYGLNAVEVDAIRSYLVQAPDVRKEDGNG